MTKGVSLRIWEVIALWIPFDHCFFLTKVVKPHAESVHGYIIGRSQVSFRKCFFLWMKVCPTYAQMMTSCGSSIHLFPSLFNSSWFTFGVVVARVYVYISISSQFVATVLIESVAPETGARIRLKLARGRRVPMSQRREVIVIQFLRVNKKRLEPLVHLLTHFDHYSPAGHLSSFLATIGRHKRRWALVKSNIWSFLGGEQPLARDKN